MDKERQKLSWLSISAMIGFALIMDLFSIIPVIGGFVAAFAYFVLGFWLWIVGQNPISIKKLVAPVISTIIEFVPVLSILPSITLATIITLSIIKIEEKTGINLSKLAQGKIAESGIVEAGEKIATGRQKKEEGENNENIVTHRRGREELREARRAV